MSERMTKFHYFQLPCCKRKEVVGSRFALYTEKVNWVGTLFSVSRAGVGNLQPAGCKQPPDLQRKQNPRALPYVDQYHLPVNRPLDPFFDSNLTPNDLVFSPHPKIPFYKIECKISNFSHAFGTFVNYQLKMTNLHSTLTQFSPNKHTSKYAIFLKPHPKPPFSTRS